MLEYGFGLIFTNILLYLLLLILIFSIFFFFNINIIQTLSDFKLINTYSFFIMTLILTLLSIAGVPPLVGFVGKFLLLVTILSNNNYLLFIILCILNIFMLYFYIQNIRFMVTRGKLSNHTIKVNYVFLDTKLLNIVCSLNIINVIGIFFFEDFIILITYWTSFSFIL